MVAQAVEAEKVWSDPDDAPELTEEWFEQAHLFDGDRLVRRGRPPKHIAKKAVSIRLSEDVLKAFRTTGPGWQTRIDQALRVAIEIAEHWVIQRSGGAEPRDLPVNELVRVVVGPQHPEVPRSVESRKPRTSSSPTERRRKRSRPE
jgi:uncharacterized protein (DUF4415 family)